MCFFRNENYENPRRLNGVLFISPLITDFVDTVRDDGIRGKMMQTAKVVFFAGLLLNLNGLVFNQEADATVCSSTAGVFEHPKEKVAIVTITVISSETETYDPPIDKIEYVLSNRVTATFAIDDIIYGNEGFPLKSDSISRINSQAVKVGDRYVVGYYLVDEGWAFYDNCSTLEHISFVEFAAFYEDLLTNPCGADMHYLVKNSDLKKICVWHDTRDKLIERGVGFFVPSLFFSEWKRISGDPPLDVSSDVYEPGWNEPHCNKAVVSSTGDYCIPYWVNLSLGPKQSNAAEGHPLKNFRGDAVFATLATDKLHYTYGEPATISGQFSDYVGRWVAFDSELVPIDSENRFSTQVDWNNLRWLSTDEVYLVLHDRHFNGVEQIKITIHDAPPPNRPPSATAVFSWETAENTTGTLTAIGSDPDNDPLTYSWKQTRGPDAALTDRDMPILRFTAPEVTEDTDIAFALTVSDGHLSDTNEIHLRVTDSPDAGSLESPPPPTDEDPEATEYVPPSRELLADFFVAYFAGNDPEEIGAAMDFVQQMGSHLNYTLTDLKEILGGAGYANEEIEAEWSTRASTR